VYDHEKKLLDHNSNIKRNKITVKNRFMGGNMNKQSTGVVIEHIFNAPVDGVWK
jgi:hypothetical protein